MGLETVVPQYSMKRRFAWSGSDLVGMGCQMGCRPCQRPSPTPRQRAGLAIERHRSQGDLLGVCRRAPGARQISELIGLCTAASPSSNCVYQLPIKSPIALSSTPALAKATIALRKPALSRIAADGACLDISVAGSSAFPVGSVACLFVLHFTPTMDSSILASKRSVTKFFF